MNTVYRRDETPADGTALRHMALGDARDMVRRAASATAAAGCGEPDALRAAVLESVRDRLNSVLAQLQAFE